MTPEISGVITQLPTIPPTLPHSTASGLTPTAAKPTIAPTIECVVDTGHPNADAISNQVAAANKRRNHAKNQQFWRVYKEAGINNTLANSLK